MLVLQKNNKLDKTLTNQRHNGDRIKRRFCLIILGLSKKIHSSFSLPSYKRTQMNFWFKPKKKKILFIIKLIIWKKIFSGMKNSPRNKRIL